MNSFELNNFLQKHTFFEKYLLNFKNNNDMQAIKSFIENTFFDKNLMRKFPLINDDNLEDFLINPKKQFETKTIPHPKNGIIFTCHPRFGEIIEHHHDYIEMVYVYSGKCNQVVNGTTIAMNKGDVCILDTNVLHSIEPASENDIIVNCLMSKKHLDNILIDRLSGNDLLSSFFIRALYYSNDFNEYILFNSSESAKLSKLMEDVLCEYFDKSLCSDEVINSYMIIIFSELLRVYENHTNTKSRHLLKNAGITDIILYIQNNCKDATLTSVSEHFHFHPNYLSTVIKKFTGNNFTFVLQEAKLKKAAFFLKNSNIPVIEVANSIGYENTNFFYKIFKKYFGCNPTEYRKNFSNE
ncbi:HTH-type transcriptional activator Btr [Clostridium puniceum]|uniref:HTH-type transcriptional activator Btr n=1 Tax=Clostridium puniceum TaxID=29367 RepID=A0A1S8TGD4_9CLOT|nr:AraC family transcriptional regulator [Clostridium puniceum]OOM76694.1 HTH-type transcriptional activator Btr [Clostridium puniceum]